MTGLCIGSISLWGCVSKERRGCGGNEKPRPLGRGSSRLDWCDGDGGVAPRGVFQPSTFTLTLVRVWALGTSTVSSPSRYTACTDSRSIPEGKRKLRLQVP